MRCCQAKGLRGAFVTLVVATGLTAAVLACGPESPPNVVLVTLDTTRPDFLGAYGGPADASPQFDRFAASATLYERAYATSSWTLASHASLLTGLLPMQHGAQSVPGAPDKQLGYGVRPLAERFTTLAEALRDAGYRTGAVVAGPALRRELGLGQGFEIYRDELDTETRRNQGKLAEDVAREALAIVDGFGDEPYFLFVNFFDPHAPYRPPPPHDAGVPAEVAGSAMRPLFERLTSGVEPTPVDTLPEPSRSALAGMRAGYAAEIRYMDLHLGRLLDRLPPNTLVIVTGDHGESFGEHFMLRHGAHLYDHNTRVPLVVRRPGQTEARRVEEPVQNHWVVSEILAASGVALPTSTPIPGLEAGAAPIVLQVQRSESNVNFFGPYFDRDLTALLDPPHKLIESTGGAVELYDLRADPEELHDLAGADAARAAALRESLRATRETHPPLYGTEGPAELRGDTEEALRALGYLE